MSRLEQAPVSHARHSHLLTYRGLLARPGALRVFGAAAVARLSFGMVSLSLLLLIHQTTGSFAAAGAATGAFSAGTLTAPAKARLMDRRGQRVMLPLLGLGAAGAMLAMVLLGLAHWRNPVTYIFLCAAAGALTPPIGPAMRALWATITGGGQGQHCLERRRGGRAQRPGGRPRRHSGAGAGGRCRPGVRGRRGPGAPGHLRWVRALR